MCTDEAWKEQHAVSNTHLPKQYKSLLAGKCVSVCRHGAEEERGKRKWKGDGGMGVENKEEDEALWNRNEKKKK